MPRSSPSLPLVPPAAGSAAAAALLATLLLAGRPGLLNQMAHAGSNGMAAKPPMTWRSWNQWGWYINETVLLEAARGLTDSSRSIRGKPAGTTLLHLGCEFCAGRWQPLLLVICRPPDQSHAAGIMKWAWMKGGQRARLPSGIPTRTAEIHGWTLEH